MLLFRIIDDLCVNNCFNHFSGIKDNKNYSHGTLHIIADKISDNPTPMPSSINSNNKEITDTDRDSDSPCQKRRTKSRKNR